MARIVVCGYMIRHPLAGNVLAYFNYVLGLHRLGHDVVYLEENGWDASCYDPSALEYGNDPTSGLDLVRSLMREHGLNVPVCWVDRQSGDVRGSTWNEIRSMLRNADLLLNVGGVCWLPEFRSCRHRVLIDMDPMFTQAGSFAGELLEDHHLHFSYGVNIGNSDCTIPTRGLQWHAALPPVVPEAWCVEDSPAAESGVFTTVANWSAYGGVEYEGAHYGQKDEEFLRVLSLPRRTAQPLELALAGADEEFERLRLEGWHVLDAAEVSHDMLTYRGYIANSRGEFSVAKNAYVKTRSGWFSDRSVCYLAAGRPVVLQDSGFSDWLPTGRGVFSFSGLDDAVDCIDRVNADYGAHRRAARQLAEEVFSYRVVLPRLVEKAIDRAKSQVAFPGTGDDS